MTTPSSVRPLRADPYVPEHVRQMLEAAREQGPTREQLERFSARMAPLVGLDAAALRPSSLPRGSAPADVARGTGAAPAGQAAAGKFGSSALLKGVAVACAIGVGGFWAASRNAPPPVQAPPALESAPPAPAARAIEPPVQDLSEPAQPEAAPAPPVVTRAPARGAVKAKPAVPDELTLIKQAQAARGEPEAALSVLAQHARLYPDGALTQEREVLAIEALVLLGRFEPARARAARLEARHPGSAHLPRVRALLEKASEP